MPLVGHQEDGWATAGLAARHRRSYSARMPETAASDAAARLAAVRDRIARAAALAGRPADAVTLIAISKTIPADGIVPLLDAGQRVFGENRVQEAQAKWPALRERYAGVALHLVGQLQSNKAADAVAAVRRDPFGRSLVAGPGARQGDRGKRPAAGLLPPGQYRRRAAEGRLRDRRTAGAARRGARRRRCRSSG